ncbi:MAG: hypothetical protein WAL22_20895 [Solirubrobacteraceae bacterium]
MFKRILEFMTLRWLGIAAGAGPEVVEGGAERVLRLGLRRDRVDRGFMCLGG